LGGPQKDFFILFCDEAYSKVHISLFYFKEIAGTKAEKQRECEKVCRLDFV